MENLKLALNSVQFCREMLICFTLMFLYGFFSTFFLTILNNELLLLDAIFLTVTSLLLMGIVYCYSVADDYKQY